MQKGDDSTAGRLGREATVTTDKIFFFLSQNWGSSSPHYSGGPVLTRNSWGARTTNKDGERHTSHEKMVKYFFCLGFMCGGCLHRHAYTYKGRHRYLSPLFWFVVSKAFGTNIYTSRTFVRKPDTT